MDLIFWRYHMEYVAIDLILCRNSYGFEYICRDFYPNHVINKMLYLLYMMVGLMAHSIPEFTPNIGTLILFSSP